MEGQRWKTPEDYKNLFVGLNSLGDVDITRAVLISRTLVSVNGKPMNINLPVTDSSVAVPYIRTKDEQVVETTTKTISYPAPGYEGPMFIKEK